MNESDFESWFDVAQDTLNLRDLAHKAWSLGFSDGYEKGDECGYDKGFDKGRDWARYERD